jgi:hypothetical protein
VQDGAGDTPLHVMCGRLAAPLLALAAERCPRGAASAQQARPFCIRCSLLP